MGVEHACINDQVHIWASSRVLGGKVKDLL